MYVAEGILLLCAVSPLTAQNRDIRAQRFVMDDDGADGSVNTLTLQAPDLGSNLTLTFPPTLPATDGSLMFVTASGDLNWTDTPSLRRMTLSDGLTVSGGVIDFSGATGVNFAPGSILFDDIGSGISTGAALIVGAGSTLTATGGGIISATEFAGNGSTTSAVDLATSEVAGVLGVSNGGTGSSTASGARTNLGLGTLSVQDASNVNITGGTISGVTFGSGVDFTDGLTVSGGTIDFSGATSVTFGAGSIGFADIGGGTSTGSALVIGAGSTLTATGGGIISATEFAGSGSTTSAVDLATSEVAGVLGVSNGGTGSSTASGARTNLGLGTLSVQDASNVNITGGTITGVTLSGTFGGNPVLSGTPEFSNGLIVSGGAVDFSGATSVTFGAGSIGFADIGDGTSTGSALVIGAGSTLTATGGGIISATEFAGSGSTTSAVDLATSEVSGILGVSNGGTGSSTASGARTNMGLGTLSVQDASNVDITGGTISGVTFGSGVDFTDGLTVSGGTIDFSGATSVTFGAGSIGFADIGDGTSTGSALVIGAGSTLTATGGGIISATEFAGSGSTTSAVDLATSEVAGVLGVSNGGTGSNTASGARTNLGLGTLSVQDASNVNITGGTISGVTLSGTFGGNPVLSGTPEFSNGLIVSGGAVDFSGATSVTFGAGSIGFDDIGGGTSTGSALVIGAGSTLTATGGGIISATEFAGSGSTTSAVDLATSEVSGVLGVSNGGTGSSTASGARTNLGLGTLSVQDASNVNITGGTISGVAFGAGSIGFDDIGDGTSTGSALVIGAGSTLTATGGGIISATEFAGSGSTTSAVDLETSEVSGILGVSNGGTGSSTASGARTNMGLGTLSVQDASNVNITGGTISGVAFGSGVDFTDGLTVSGGTIDFSGATSVTFGAGSIGFADIGGGTSTGSALVIGSGSTLTATGGGIISANEFAGSGSTTSAVDLATSEVSGVLGVSNGGTNSTATPTAGGIAYGNGASYQFTAAGTAGQFLMSDGVNPPTWSSVLPSASAPFSLTGSPATGAMLTINENGANSPDLLDLQVAGSSVLVVENNGETGFGTTTPEHPVHAVNSQTTDERAAVYGAATGATTNQAVGVWGDASNTGTGNTGSVGVLASGNGNSAAGTTNIALQVSDGEFTMGRTTQTGTGYTVVEGAVGGVAYSAEGPSGIVDIAIPAIVVALPVVGQSIFNATITINNRYVSANSIVLVTVQDAPAGLLSLLGARLVSTASVSARASGSFNLTFAIQNLSLLPLNLGTGNVRVGYMVINPSR